MNFSGRGDQLVEMVTVIEWVIGSAVIDLAGYREDDDPARLDNLVEILDIVPKAFIPAPSSPENPDLKN